MADLELHMEDGMMSHIDLDGFFGNLPEAGDIIGACSSTNASSSSLDSGLSWFDEIENILMKDDEDGGVVSGGIRANSSQEFCDRFLADVLVDSPGDGSAEIANGSGDKEEPGSSDDGGVDAAKVDGAKGGGEVYDPASKKLRRENMRSSRYESMLWLQRHKRCQKKGGQCRMALPGLEITPGITLE
ncbi:uncharacterized protein LOC108956690 [Eucalyptus grandis]|uniref:uncharacterized protein LOC108956690 n=1 Tax=Eucalyptus grandis TaxID=71139 RepID=UPI00192F0D89|nr:uncharacterized protein LOC108956690 [Eucalyptus grandis]